MFERTKNDKMKVSIKVLKTLFRSSAALFRAAEYRKTPETARDTKRRRELAYLWCKVKKQSLKSVHVAYNNSFRILHHLPSCCSASFMFVSNHIKSFNELTRSSIFSLLRRLQDSENPLFVNYFYTDI